MARSVQKNKNQFRGNGGKGKSAKFNGKDKEFEGKNASKFNKKDNEGGATSASNSPDWYGSNSHLMQNAAQLSLGTGTGRELVVRTRTVDNTMADAGILNPTGIMTFDVVLNPGPAKDWNSPANLAARHIYTYVRHVNSGHANYDAANLMMYFTLMDNAYAYYAWMVRLYGVMRTIMLRNRYVPYGIVRAMGFDYNEFARNLADFRYYINVYAARLNQMAVPDCMPIFKRHMWMLSNVYADAPTDKAQLYMFNPRGFWRHVITDDDAYLQLVGVPTNYLLVQTNGDDFLNQILQSEDFNIMSGDVMKAYGDRLFKVNPIAEDYSVVPAYDPEVLLQIHNLQWINEDPLAYDRNLADSWRIKEYRADAGTDRTGALIFSPMVRYTYDNTPVFSDGVIDFPVGDINPTLVALATRFKLATGSIEYSATFTEDSRWYARLKHHGTEICTKVQLWGFDPAIRNFSATVLNPIKSLNTAPVDHFEQRPFMYDCFYKPASSSEDGNPKGTFNDVYGDLNNYGVITDSTLENIHEAALLALYGLV